MDILFVGLNYAPEDVGIGPYSFELTQALANAGHSVRVVTAVPYYPGWRTFSGYRGMRWRQNFEHGISVLRCPIYVPAQPTGTKRILHHISFAISLALPVLWHVLRKRPNLVIAVAPSLIGSSVALAVSQIAGSRSWLHIQDFELEAAFATGLVASKGRAGRLGAAFEQLVLRRFDFVSSISPQMVSRLHEKGVPAEKTYELRNWADIDRVQPLDGPSPYQLTWDIQTPYVALYSGNIANKQGIEVVVEAARLLSNRNDLTFVICGEGPSRAALVAAASKLHNIQFHDLQPRDKLSQLLGLATVHLLPQLANAADLVLPSKLTNMLASGRPVIATAAAGTGLHDEVDGCGLTVPPGDAQAFAAAIEVAIDSPEARRRWGAAGRARAEERWSQSEICDRFITRLAEDI